MIVVVVRVVVFVVVKVDVTVLVLGVDEVAWLELISGAPLITSVLEQTPEVTVETVVVTGTVVELVTTEV